MGKTVTMPMDEYETMKRYYDSMHGLMNNGQLLSGDSSIYCFAYEDRFYDFKIITRDEAVKTAHDMNTKYKSLFNIFDHLEEQKKNLEREVISLKSEMPEKGNVKKWGFKKTWFFGLYKRVKK